MKSWLCNFSKSEPLKVMSFERFKALCLLKYNKDNDNLLERHLTAGCVRCQTGAAIKAGRLTKLPDNVGLIDLEETKPMPTSKSEITLPSGIDPKVLENPKLQHLTSPNLRPFWLMEVPPAKKVGVCVNCRTEVMINGCGLCSKCYYAGSGRKGKALLSSLAAAESRQNQVAAGFLGEKKTTMESQQPAAESVTSAPPPTESLGAVDRHWKIQDLEGELMDRDGIIGSAIDALLGDGEEIDNLAVLVRRRIDEIQELKEKVWRRDERILHAIDALREDDAIDSLEGLTSRRMSELKELKERYRTGNLAMADVGYEPLFDILAQALIQAQVGKGRDRHANGLPFLSQPIMIETRSVGLGFPAGQARKKILEAINCCELHPERAIADLLGAINYTAAAILGITEKQAAGKEQR